MPRGGCGRFISLQFSRGYGDPGHSRSCATLARRAALWDHGGMKPNRLTVTLAGLLVVAPTFLWAAESAPAAKPAEPRELLKPPKMSVATPATDHLALRGVFSMSTYSTDVRYDSSAGLAGTLVNGEDTLGFPSKVNQGRVDLTFRMAEKHRIRADFQKMWRSGDQFIDQPIRFGNEVYQFNDRVLSSFDMRRLGINYSYSVLRGERYEVGFGLALHLLQIEGTLEAPARFVRESLDAAGPFATLRMDASWSFTRRFSVNIDAQYLGGSVDEVEGKYQSFSGDVQFRAHRNLAIGVGYSSTRMMVDSTEPTFSGLFDLRFSGPEAFVRVSY
jgi:hypothetical protein